MKKTKQIFTMLLITVIFLFISCTDGRNIQEISFPQEFRGNYSGTYELTDGSMVSGGMTITPNNYRMEFHEIGFYYDFHEQISDISDQLEELYAKRNGNTFIITSVNIQGVKSNLIFTLDGETLTYKERVGANGIYQTVAFMTLNKD